MDALKLTDEERNACLRRIQRYSQDERGEDLGELAQLLIYGFFAEELASSFYNEGLRGYRGVGALSASSEAESNRKRRTSYPALLLRGGCQ